MSDGVLKNKIDLPHIILFLMGASVILITIGIIQTLFFETWGFFEEVAESRGWFVVKWDLGGIFSDNGFGCVLIFVCVIIEYLFTKNPHWTNNFPSLLFNF